MPKDLDWVVLVRRSKPMVAAVNGAAVGIGLTQILPSTGRSLARRLGISGFKTSYLYRPEINVNMGTYYLRGMIDDLGGQRDVGGHDQVAGLEQFENPVVGDVESGGDAKAPDVGRARNVK